jgi:hypothetical protein
LLLRWDRMQSKCTCLVSHFSVFCSALIDLSSFPCTMFLFSFLVARILKK